MKKILVVDGNCILYNSIFIWRASKKIPLQYFFLRSLAKYMKEFNPDMTYIVADGGKSWRKDIYPNYKGQRKEKREAEEDIPWTECFKTYDALLQDINTYLPITTLKIPSLEGDDLISYLCRYLKGDITIISKDKDLQQLLVLPYVSMYDMHHKRLLTRPEDEDILATKITKGDKSDNIPSASSFSEEIRNSILIDLLNLPKVIDSCIRSHMEVYNKQVDIQKFIARYNYKFVPTSSLCKREATSG